MTREVWMIFITLILTLSGLALLFSAIENKPIKDYLSSWLGGKKA
jgi:hypothetical protein